MLPGGAVWRTRILAIVICDTNLRPYRALTADIVKIYWYGSKEFSSGSTDYIIACSITCIA